MESKQVTYFLWSDIQKEICKEMGISEADFRDYHKIVGGNYKDLWHEWLEYFEDSVRNDSITNGDLGDDLETKLEWIVEEEGKSWLKPFVEAIYKVWDKYDIKNIKYSW